MFQLFYLDVAYVVMDICVYCECMLQMFHLFHTLVASVLSGCCICCSCYIHMLQSYVSIGFTLFQYFAASSAPHVPWLAGTHARTHYTHAANMAYLCHAGQLQHLDATQTTEHSLVKVHAERRNGPAPNGCRTRRPAPPSLAPMVQACSMQPSHHMGTRTVLPLFLLHAAGWAPTHLPYIIIPWKLYTTPHLTKHSTL
jgi:hypothetical protein